MFMCIHVKKINIENMFWITLYELRDNSVFCLRCLYGRKPLSPSMFPYFPGWIFNGTCGITPRSFDGLFRLQTVAYNASMLSTSDSSLSFTLLSFSVGSTNRTDFTRLERILLRVGGSTVFQSTRLPKLLLESEETRKPADAEHTRRGGITGASIHAYVTLEHSLGRKE